MRVIIDMNLSPHWVDVLTGAGFAASHWSILGVGDAPDVEIKNLAATEGNVVLTHDLDFGAILAATGGGKPSVVQIRGPDVDPDSIGRAVIAALRQMADDLESGALITVDPSRTRMRLLPLGPK